MFDADLARLQEVETRALVQAVKRNIERFPADFMFQLTQKEFDSLRSQSVISNPEGRGGRRYLPYTFTEQGVAMLSSVLRSDRAIQVNVEIMRAFVRLRQMLASHKELARKLAALEKKYDTQFRVVFDAIRELMTPPQPKNKRPIGFSRGEMIKMQHLTPQLREQINQGCKLDAVIKSNLRELGFLQAFFRKFYLILPSNALYCMLTPLHHNYSL